MVHDASAARPPQGRGRRAGPCPASTCSLRRRRGPDGEAACRLAAVPCVALRAIGVATADMVGAFRPVIDRLICIRKIRNNRRKRLIPAGRVIIANSAMVLTLV